MKTENLSIGLKTGRFLVILGTAVTLWLTVFGERIPESTGEKLEAWSLGNSLHSFAVKNRERPWW